MAGLFNFDKLIEEMRRASGMPNGQAGGGNPFAQGTAGQARGDASSVADEAQAYVDANDSSAQGGSAGRGASPFGGFGNFGGFGGNGADGTSFVNRMSEWGKKALIIALIVLVIVLAGAYWWFHPPINIHSTDTWLFGAIFILLPLFLLFSSKRLKYTTGKKVEASPAKAKTFKYLSYIPLLVVVIGLIGALLSLSFIPGNAKKYANILQTESLDFAQDIQEVNYTEIPIIDRDTAIVLGNKEMGTIADYVSQFEVDDLYSQINYQNKPVRVSPLNYADLFKWLTNRSEGIPAYCLIDMTTQDAAIVRISDVDGTTGEGIKYSQSEPLVRNIDRHVQLSYPFYMFDELSFEIDENGHPWWICPVQTREIGLFGGTNIYRVVLCDAVSGECFDYAVDECPQWVDRVYPADLLITQYNWSGKYASGWFNSWLGQSGVVQTTPGSSASNLGYNYIAKGDDVWVYTGVTSAVSDSSIVGFVLINQRTAESHFYSVSGATETSAMGSAEGQVQHLRYTATFPILINVANQPTYFMALKDAAGLVKQFAMIDIQRYQNVAVGDTVADTQKSYLALLATNGIDTSSEVVIAGASETSGKIKAMNVAIMNGNTHYYVILEGDSTVYDFALPGLLQIVAYAPGDSISFTYTEKNGIYTANSITDAGAPKVGISGS